MTNDTPAPDAEIEPTDDDAIIAAFRKTESLLSPYSKIAPATYRVTFMEKSVVVSREDALAVARERLAQTPAPVSQDSAAILREVRRVLGCRDGVDIVHYASLIHSFAESGFEMLVEKDAKESGETPQDSAPRAMPPEIAAFLASIRHRMSNLGLGVSPDEVVWLLDALEAAYAPRDESAGLLSDPREREIIEDALDKWIEGDRIPDFAERDLRAKLLGEPGAAEPCERYYRSSEIDSLVRAIDVALNGDGAAQQAMLCDIVGQVENERRKTDLPLIDAIHAYAERDRMVSLYGKLLGEPKAGA